MSNLPRISRRALSKSAVGALAASAIVHSAHLPSARAQDATPVASPGTCPATTPDENEAIVRRYWEEVWNQQHDDALREVFDVAEVHHWGLGVDTTGVDAFLVRIAAFRTAFPDMHFDIENVIREGDQVVSYWVATATHEGDWLGIPATGKKIEYAGVNIFRIACGKIVESWGIADHLGLLQQLGGLPSVATPTT